MNIFVEALKEGARVCVLAIIPLLIEMLGKGAIDWTLIAVTGAIALLRFLDKYLHLEGEPGVADGLTRF